MENLTRKWEIIFGSDKLRVFDTRVAQHHRQCVCDIAETFPLLLSLFLSHSLFRLSLRRFSAVLLCSEIDFLDWTTRRRRRKVDDIRYLSHTMLKWNEEFLHSFTDSTHKKRISAKDKERAEKFYIQSNFLEFTSFLLSLPLFHLPPHAAWFLYFLHQSSPLTCWWWTFDVCAGDILWRP